MITFFLMSLGFIVMVNGFENNNNSQIQNFKKLSELACAAITNHFKNQPREDKKILFSLFKNTLTTDSLNQVLLYNPSVFIDIEKIDILPQHTRTCAHSDCWCSSPRKQNEDLFKNSFYFKYLYPYVLLTQQHKEIFMTQIFDCKIKAIVFESETKSEPIMQLGYDSLIKANENGCLDILDFRNKGASTIAKPSGVLKPSSRQPNVFYLIDDKNGRKTFSRTVLKDSALYVDSQIDISFIEHSSDIIKVLDTSLPEICFLWANPHLYLYNSLENMINKIELNDIHYVCCDIEGSVISLMTSINLGATIYTYSIKDLKKPLHVFKAPVGSLSYTILSIAHESVHLIGCQFECGMLINNDWIKLQDLSLLHEEYIAGCPFLAKDASNNLYMLKSNI